jgi:hypothetical protein
MKRTIWIGLWITFAFVFQACAFHSTAKQWNGRTGADGEPVYYTATTKVGLNFLIAFTFLGDTGIDGMVDDMTANIQEEGGDHVRIVQGSSENYWYGFPPITWILTPVISTVSADYRPDPEVLAKDLEEMRAEEQ